MSCFSSNSAIALMLDCSAELHCPHMILKIFSMFLRRFACLDTKSFISSLYMSLSTVSALSEGAVGLYFDLKLAVGSFMDLKIDFASAPSFRFEITYVEVLSKNTSNDVAFFLNFSYFRPSTAPISGMLPSKLFESVC